MAVHVPCSDWPLGHDVVHAAHTVLLVTPAPWHAWTWYEPAAHVAQAAHAGLDVPPHVPVR